MEQMPPSLKYAHLEREQRFLLTEVPSGVKSIAAMTIHDRYLIGTQLRLRSVEEPDGAPILKLGQKIRMAGPSPAAVAHTTMYLDRDDYSVLAALSAQELRKDRRVVLEHGTRMAVDEFHGHLEGLVLAEVDLGEHRTPISGLPIPVVAEVTDDERFTGGALAATTTDALGRLLSEFTS